VSAKILLRISQARFSHVDGVRFLVHEGGCGGTRQDSKALCGLLAGYIHHPNVAGATVLSLGCQNAQPSILMDALRERDPGLHKPVLMFEQQKSGLESAMLPRPLAPPLKAWSRPSSYAKASTSQQAHRRFGVWGSDGFSGISANPAIGMSPTCWRRWARSQSVGVSRALWSGTESYQPLRGAEQADRFIPIDA